jgi:hypothetical protein
MPCSRGANDLRACERLRSVVTRGSAYGQMERSELLAGVSWRPSAVRDIDPGAVWDICARSDQIAATADLGKCLNDSARRRMYFPTMLNHYEAAS